MHKITDNKRFFKDYKRFVFWVKRNGTEKPFPHYTDLSIGKKAMLRLAREYVEYLEKRDKVISFYNEMYDE